MESSDYTFDIGRIFLGHRSWLFLVEILIRTFVIYVYALFTVRVLGKRGMGQLAPFDFVIIIALGSAVGDPMFYPEVPLLHAMTAITLIVLFSRALVHITRRSRRVQDFISTSPTRLIADGELDLECMKSEGLSRPEFFESLRCNGLEQLGQVERAYLEPSGKISTFCFRASEVRQGVPLIPEGAQLESELVKEGEVFTLSSSYGCWNCGHIQSFTQSSFAAKCSRCRGCEWVKAVCSYSDSLDESKSPKKNSRGRVLDERGI